MTDNPPYGEHEAVLPEDTIGAVHETSLSSLIDSPDYLPVYTVFLRRSAAVSVAGRPNLTTPAEVAGFLWEYLKETDREHFVMVFLDTRSRAHGHN